MAPASDPRWRAAEVAARAVEADILLQESRALLRMARERHQAGDYAEARALQLRATALQREALNRRAELRPA